VQIWCGSGLRLLYLSVACSDAQYITPTKVYINANTLRADTGLIPDLLANIGPFTTSY
jgi:hypothetical protein